MASNYVPMVSSSPPPFDDGHSLEDDDEEFGSFACATIMAIQSDPPSPVDRCQKENSLVGGRPKQSTVDEMAEPNCVCIGADGSPPPPSDMPNGADHQIATPGCLILSDLVPGVAKDLAADVSLAREIAGSDVRAVFDPVAGRNSSELTADFSESPESENDARFDPPEVGTLERERSSQSLEHSDKQPEEGRVHCDVEVRSSNSPVRNESMDIASQESITDSGLYTSSQFSGSSCSNPQDDSLHTTVFSPDCDVTLPRVPSGVVETPIVVLDGDDDDGSGMRTSSDTLTDLELVDDDVNVKSDGLSCSDDDDDSFKDFVCSQQMPSLVGAFEMRFVPVGEVNPTRSELSVRSCDTDVVSLSETSNFHAGESEEASSYGDVRPTDSSCSRVSDEFADFQTAMPSDLVSDGCMTMARENCDGEPSQSVVDAESDDEFGNFATFAVEAVESPFRAFHSDPSSEIAEDGEEFGNFDSARPFGEHLENLTGGVDMVSKVLTLAFPVVVDVPTAVPIEHLEKALTKCPYARDSKTSKCVWPQLQDIDNTHALAYHWSSSQANKKMLNSLHINAPSLLAGTRWSASIPLFAANLSIDPLEPTKAPLKANREEKTMVSGVELLSSVVGAQESTVPPAQFDWGSSGLVNPLDGLETEFLGALPSMNQPTNSGKKQMLSPLLDKILSEAARSSTGTYSQPSRRRSSTLSAEARQILDSLPDLSFMRAKVLMFPIRSVVP